MKYPDKAKYYQMWISQLPLKYMDRDNQSSAKDQIEFICDIVTNSP